MCTSLSKMMLCSQEVKAGNNNNNYDNVYGAIIMTSHCKSSPGSFDECRLSTGWPPTLRPSQSTWAVSPPKTGSYHPHPPSPLLLLLHLGRLTLQLDELTTRLLRPESFHMWLNVSTAGKTARLLVNKCHT